MLKECQVDSVIEFTSVKTYERIFSLKIGAVFFCPAAVFFTPFTWVKKTALFLKIIKNKCVNSIFDIIPHEITGNAYFIQ